MTGLIMDMTGITKKQTEALINALDGSNIEVPKRKPGRPARGKRPAVKITVNLDPHLYAMLDTVADQNQEPASRVLNKILQVFYDTTFIKAYQ